MNEKKLREALWRRGNLSWKLHQGQKDLYDLYQNGKEKTNVWLLGRRCGKSFALSCLAIEKALQKANSIIKFISPTKIQTDTNITPLFRIILEDCPKDLKPKHLQKEYKYVFPNGSEIHMAGTDNGHAERLRGIDCELAIIDEAGTCSDLKNIVNSILLPTTLLTKGKIILASTPPADLDHDFISFIDNADARGTLIKKPSTENPMLAPEDIELLKVELGGENSEAYQREILCKIIRSSESTIIPEFNEDMEKEIVKEWTKPLYFQYYEGMDLGFTDKTAVSFVYHDFAEDKIIVEDELILDFQENNVFIDTLIDRIQEVEKRSFFDTNTNEQLYPKQRVSDINPIVTHEIYNRSKGIMNFLAPNKFDRDANINYLRTLISNKKLIIHPRCVNTVKQIRNAKWTTGKGRKEFIRSKEHGHFDLLAALIYVVRNINVKTNPYPKDGANSDRFHVSSAKNKQLSKDAQVFGSIFGVKKRDDKHLMEIFNIKQKK